MSNTSMNIAAGWSEVVVVAPTGRDSNMVCSVLESTGIRSRSLQTLTSTTELSHAAALVIAEEALDGASAAALLNLIESQPVWSDLPIFILAGDPSRGMLNKDCIERAYNSGNVTILRRPIPRVSLVSAIRAGLRARGRQFEVRELLQSRERDVQDRDHFLAMLAHELRNPLAPIRAGLHIWKMANCDDTQRAVARESMERQVQHLARMVDDLLDVARISRGQITLRKERMDLTALVKACTDDHASSFEASGIRLQVELPPYPVWVNIDKTRITQVIGNLLHNAGKFTEKGGRVKVDLQARPLDRTAVIHVWDTGIGMTREMLSRVFQPFNQADRTLDRSRGGLGLGLVLAKKLIELHDGRIEAASEGLNRGVHMTVTLRAQFETPQQSDTARSKPHTRKKVLLIEDNIDSAETLKILLELMGHNVAVAHNGQEGLSRASDLRPQVILCDIGLPGIDGYEVAKAIRSRQLVTNCHLIAMTGYGQEEDQRRARDAGFDMHLTKPVDPVVLEAVVGN
ncbi:MAG TPA: ATP-binding protein [Planctomycetota bacterium]|nr:ATP-binding protein [Planctomycetota bacterium]